MIKEYTINYDFYKAEAKINIDSNILTEEDVNNLLDFFSWTWNSDNDIYEELAIKYGLQAIKMATADNLNLTGVLDYFKNAEGFPSMDGSVGIELTYIDSYEFDEDDIQLHIIEL